MSAPYKLNQYTYGFLHWDKYPPIGRLGVWIRTIFLRASLGLDKFLKLGFATHRKMERIRCPSVQWAGNVMNVVADIDIK